MSTIIDFKDQLVTAGVGTYATDLFIGRMPGTPDTAVELSHPGGAPPRRVMGVGAASVVHYSPTIAVLVRGATYDVCTAKMAAVIAAMDNYVGTIGTTRYLHIGLQYGPIDLGQDENKRFRQSAMFTVRGASV